MKSEDVVEEHRKYLELSDNPKKPTNTSIFVLLSEGLTKVNEKINGIKIDVARLEVRTEERHKQQRREQAVIVTALLGLLGIALWQLGIPIPVVLP